MVWTMVLHLIDLMILYQQMMTLQYVVGYECNSTGEFWFE